MKKKENLSYAQSHITDAILNLMERENFESITITDIVNEAGVSRASFYRNYASKEDVLKQHLFRMINNCCKDFENKFDSSWMPSLLWHFYNNKNLYLLLYKSDLSHLILETMKDINSNMNPDQDNIHAYFSAFICAGIFGWVDEWIKRGMKETPDEIMELIEQAKQMAMQKATNSE